MSAPTARGKAAAAVLSAGLLFSLAACGSPTASDGVAELGPGVQAMAVNQAAVAQLPKSIRDSGVLTVAIPTNEPPTQFYKEGTREMTGSNPDIARLIGQALGVKVDIKITNFDSIIPGMAAGRYDMTVSSMTPTENRMKVLDFVDYLQMGNSIAVAKGNPQALSEEAELCGKKVGLLIGSYQLTANVPAANEKCVSEGKQPIADSEFQDTRQAISALTSGRLDAVLADSPILDFAAKANPAIEISSQYDFTPVGVGLPIESGLVKAVSAAMVDIVNSDSYKQVLKKYGLQSSAITDPRVNFAQ